MLVCTSYALLLMSLNFFIQCFNVLSHSKCFKMSRHLEMPPEVALLPFTLKCLPFALKSSRTCTYEITYIRIYATKVCIFLIRIVYICEFYFGFLRKC